ncbi:hypothetical protein IHE55_17455 [Streptomyces pactum]|uniref:DUF3558 domain-containing protein n=1 Tax=Streptomyces pactum TaxID=68249 RepID=A0ABS0NMN8_9ACTN|nr:lipoprotein [Streptomyces pactum]MBH5336465.1 hypothetical protein [Streptomyces pactum]
MRGSGRAVVGAAVATLVIGVLAGCSGQSGDDDSGNDNRSAAQNGRQNSGKDGGAESGGKDGGKDAGATGPAASSGKQVGAKGTACTLPVTFDLAKSWKAGAIEETGSDDPEVAELLEELTKQGEVRLTCELDAKPAGHVGFIRVYTGKASAGGGDSRKVLEGFVADAEQPAGQKYSPVKAAGLNATEVTYTTHNKEADVTKEERALALVTPQGAVVVHLGGLDTEEHRAMVPAFELAKKTMAVPTA